VAESAGLAAVYELTYDRKTGENLTRTIHIVGLADLEDRVTITMDDAVENISLSPDAKLLAIGRGDGRLQVNDTASGAIVAPPIDTDEYPCCLGTLVWSRDGSRLHTGGQDGVLRTFDTSTWKQIDEHPLTIGSSALRLSQLTEDGSTIIVPAESGQVFLIDEATGQTIGKPFISAGTQLQRATLMRGGAVLAAESRDGKLRLWDVATHRLIGHALVGHIDDTMSLEPTSDDVVVSAGANDGQVIEWNLDPQVWMARACALAGRNLTHEEWDVYVGGDYATTCEQWPAGE
jgi:WD40 repeat protein